MQQDENGKPYKDPPDAGGKVEMHKIHSSFVIQILCSPLPFYESYIKCIAM